MLGLPGRAMIFSLSQFSQAGMLREADLAAGAQVTLWRDTRQRRLVVAFRGTEQSRWRDLVTDALIAQADFVPGQDDEAALPPLLQSASASLSSKVAQAVADEERFLEESFHTSLVGAGSLGSLTAQLSRVSSLTDLVRTVTGRADYELGDLTKEALSQLSESTAKSIQQMTGKDSYEFGDLTRAAVSAASSAAAGYQFGDVTKGVLAQAEGVLAKLPATFGGGGGEADARALAAAAAAGEAAAPAQGGAAMEAETSAVHVGFLRGYLSVRTRLLTMIEALKRDEGGDWSVYVTGHSLGGALATICAADLGSGICAADDVVMYNFGSPRVGNLAFVKHFNGVVPEAFRVGFRV